MFKRTKIVVLSLSLFIGIMSAFVLISPTPAFALTCRDGHNTPSNLSPSDAQAICDDHQIGTSQSDSTERASCNALPSGPRQDCLDELNRERTQDAIEDANPGGGSGSESDITRGGNLDADCDEDTNADGTSLDKEDCGITAYIVTITNVLSVMVGIVVVIMIAVGGLRYATSGDDPQVVAAAKGHIRNAIFALVAYFFGFALLQWLIPGGMF